MNTQNKETLLTELLSFCAQPSVATQNLGMKEMAKIVATKMKELGAIVKVVTAKNSFEYILADLKAKKDADKKKTVLIYNHYDVQPVGDSSEWNSEPFKPVITKGKVYARGVSDNKGDLMARIQAVRMLLSEGDLPVNIKWLIEGEEEIGSPHLKDLQEKYGDFWKDSDLCIWEDGRVDAQNRPIASLGMKGILYVELTSKVNKSDLHSKLAGLVESPVWRLISALKTLRSDTGEVLVDGFYKKAVVPTNTEFELIKSSLVDPKKMVGESAEKLLVSANDKINFLKTAYFKGTANICGIYAGFNEEGGVKTIIPNKAMAKLDFRLVYGQKPDEVLVLLKKHLKKHGFADIEVKKLASLYPTKTSIENRYVKACFEVLEKVYKKKPVVDITSLGGGPTYPVAAIYKIPTVEIGVGYPTSNMHGANENIRISDYFKNIEAIQAYLRKLADI